MVFNARSFFFVSMLLVGLTFWSAPSMAGVYNPETFTLKNGMQVVVVSNHRAPVVTHMVWYKVGAADEPMGKSGVAHYLEHLMFKGTKTMGPGEFSKIVAKNGGRENAFTGHDYTGYYQTIAKAHLETMMRLESDRMTNLILSKEIIEPERSVVLEERRSRIENDPASILQEQAAAAFYLHYPYQVPIIGWEHEIKSLDLDAINAFYQQWYGPENAILVVAGDITAKELKPLAEKYYGKVPKRNLKGRDRVVEPDHRASRRLSLSDERVRQPQWVRMFKAPSYLYGDQALAYPLQLLENIIGDGATSRLYKSLVVDQKIALAAGAGYDASRIGPSQFIVYAVPAPGTSMDQLEAAIEVEIEALLAEGVSADEVNRSKKRMSAQAIYARDSLSGGAWAIGSALAAGMSIDTVESWPENIEAVTKDDIDQAIKAIFAGPKPLTYKLLPKEDA